MKKQHEGMSGRTQCTGLIEDNSEPDGGEKDKEFPFHRIRLSQPLSVSGA